MRHLDRLYEASDAPGGRKSFPHPGQPAGASFKVGETLAGGEHQQDRDTLSACSPELNPDELLNADLKQKVTAAAPACSKYALTTSASRSLRNIQRQIQRVQNYFLRKDVSYAAQVL